MRERGENLYAINIQNLYGPTQHTLRLFVGFNCSN